MSDAVAPLAAYTVSGQAAASGSSSSSSKRKGKGKERAKHGSTSSYQARPRKFRSKGTLDFDEASRAEYLTGFRKRKAARIEHARKKREEEEKEERKRLRKEGREAKKEKARENVEAERKAYAEDSEDEEDEGEDEDENGQETDAGESRRATSRQEQTYDDDGEEGLDPNEYQTTVTIAEWDPDAPEEYEPRPVAKAAPKSKKRDLTEALPPSSKRQQKKLKPKAEPSSQLSSKTKSSKPSRSADAKDLSSLLTTSSYDSTHLPEVESAARAAAQQEAAKSSRSGGFSYKTKAEKLKEKAQVHEKNEKMRQMRLEKEKEDRIRNKGRRRVQGGSKGKKR